MHVNHFGNPRAINDITVHIGQRLYECRKQLGFTQVTVAEAIGISFQQLQKYEKGKNRLSCTRLWQFCGLYKVSPLYFFEGLPVSNGKIVFNPPLGAWCIETINLTR